MLKLYIWTDVYTGSQNMAYAGDTLTVLAPDLRTARQLAFDELVTQYGENVAKKALSRLLDKPMMLKKPGAVFYFWSE